MQIRNNISAINTYRNLSNSSTQIQKTYEKLSSGYKINRAADDAAGLSISEKMRGQISGLQQASQNIQDGMSLINVAESGLGQIQNPNLVRMRELVIQAANDTNTLEDRQKIQMEIDQIKEGINDIAEGTEYNTIPVLTPTDLKPTADKTPKFDVVFLIDDSGTMSNNIKMVAQGLSTFSEKMKTWGDVTFGSTSVAIPYSTDHTRDLAVTTDIQKLTDHLNSLKANGGITQTEKVLNELLDSSSALGGRAGAQKVYVIVTDTRTEDNLSDLDNSMLQKKVQDSGAQVYTIGVRNKWNSSTDFEALYSDFSTGVFVANQASDISEKLTPNLADEIAINSDNSHKLQKDIIIQAGANEGQTIVIPLHDNRSEAIGVNSINVVESYEHAMEALNRIDIANRIISDRRGTYGAIYNRLEHANNNVQNMAELLTKAESGMRDADIEKEITKLTQNQVLMQSAQSMMTQINQMSQGILQLLQ